MARFAELFALGITAVVAVYYTVHLAMIFLAAVIVRRQRKVSVDVIREAFADSPSLPGVSVVVPAYNEERSIVQTVESVLRLRYPLLEVVVVSDGSTDRTIPALDEAFGLEPSERQPRGLIQTQNVRERFVSRLDSRLHLLDKRNGGKADALNAGINHSLHPLVLAVDADVVLEPYALLHLALPFATDERTVASTGMLRPLNGCEILADGKVLGGLPGTWLERWQVIEYLRAYGFGRMFFDYANAHLIISGAFGLFSRRVLLAIGGYQPHAVGEDMELVVRLHRHLRERGEAYKIAYAVDALCLTHAPFTLDDLGRQRTRWHQGLLTTLQLHRSMLFRPRFRAVGLVAFPYYTMELIAPIAEAAGWVLLPLLVLAGYLPPADAVPFFAFAILMGIATSFAVLLFDVVAFRFFSRVRDTLALAVAGLLECFGYRQATVFFRLRAFARHYRAFNLSAMWRSPTRLRSRSGGREREV